MKRFLLFFAFLSGTCGIAYELLFTRMLSTYLGDMFYVAAAILSTFLLGLALGNAQAHRWPRALGWVEMAIGGYAGGLAYLFYHHGESLTYLLAGGAGGSPLALVAAVVALLLIPAVLIGFSVPLFSLYCAHHKPKEDFSEPFRRVYLFYNLGAALCVLAVEYWLLREFGISASTLMLALVNLFIGWAVLRVPAPQTQKDAPALSLKDKTLLALFVTGVGSGIFQLMFLKIAHLTFGPFHENFAIVLALALAGIALGSVIAGKIRISPAGFTLAAGVAVASLAIFAEPWVMAWAALNENFAVHNETSWILKIFMLVGLGLVPFTLLGAIIPVFLRQENSHDHGRVGAMLAASAAGNCVGFISLLILNATLVDAFILPTAGALFLLAALFVWHPVKKLSLAAGVLAATLTLAAHGWPEFLLSLGYPSLKTTANIKFSLAEFEKSEVYKKYDTTITLGHKRNGELNYIINGYRSLTLGRGAEFRELIFGTAPAVYARHNTDALVLGLGTGITSAGAYGSFKNVEVVELSPLTYDMLPVFAKYNLNLAQRPDLQVTFQDGLIALSRSGKKYDAIINTVTSPAYFTSAKLYTQDFFQLAANHLKEGGVYTLWVDSRIPLSGLRSTFRSLQEVFTTCRFLSLTPAYHQVICGQGTLLPQHRNTEDFSPELRQAFTRVIGDMPIPEFVEYTTFRHHPAFPGKTVEGTDWKAPANTFDHPVLEFDISRFILNIEPSYLGNRRLPEDFGVSLAGAPLATEQKVARCFAMFLAGQGDSCLEAISQNGAPPASYVDLRRSLFMRLPSERRAVALVGQFFSSPDKMREALEILEAGMCADTPAGQAPTLFNGRDFQLRQSTLLQRANLVFALHGNLPDADLYELKKLAGTTSAAAFLVSRVMAARRAGAAEPPPAFTCPAGRTQRP